MAGCEWVSACACNGAAGSCACVRIVVLGFISSVEGTAGLTVCKSSGACDRVYEICSTDHHTSVPGTAADGERISTWFACTSTTLWWSLNQSQPTITNTQRTGGPGRGGRNFQGPPANAQAPAGGHGRREPFTGPLSIDKYVYEDRRRPPLAYPQQVRRRYQDEPSGVRKYQRVPVL